MFDILIMKYSYNMINEGVRTCLISGSKLFYELESSIDVFLLDSSLYASFLIPFHLGVIKFLTHGVYRWQALNQLNQDSNKTPNSKEHGFRVFGLFAPAAALGRRDLKAQIWGGGTRGKVG